MKIKYHDIAKISTNDECSFMNIGDTIDGYGQILDYFNIGYGIDENNNGFVDTKNKTQLEIINNMLEIQIALCEWDGINNYGYNHESLSKLLLIIQKLYMDESNELDECNDGLTDLFSFIIVCMGANK